MAVEKITGEEINNYLKTLAEWEALELQTVSSDGGTDVLIPYVMNDAAEYFLRLKNCRVQGRWISEFDGAAEYSLIENDGKYGLIFRQKEQNTVTVWFESVFKEEHCYQYHRIGHDWREKKGEEHWRRLVNILCVLHDKYTYLGESACNALEIKIYSLIEFAPLCYFTPINQSIAKWYPETVKGIAAMKELAKEAGDEAYLELILKYEKLTNERKRARFVKVLAKELQREEHICIYQKLLEKIEQASLLWECRDYGEQENLRIEGMRKSAEDRYKELGYEGKYPLMQMKDKMTGRYRQVYFVEEHPFTVMESEEYEFHIYAMESETVGNPRGMIKLNLILKI